MIRKFYNGCRSNVNLRVNRSNKTDTWRWDRQVITKRRYETTILPYVKSKKERGSHLHDGGSL